MSKEKRLLGELFNGANEVIIVLNIKHEGGTSSYTLGMKGTVADAKKTLTEGVNTCFGPTAVAEFPVIYQKQETTGKDKKIKFIYKKIE